MARLRAALLDVGGTLWESLSSPPEVVLRRLAAVLPGRDEAFLELLRVRLEEGADQLNGLAQPTDRMVARVATDLGVDLGPGTVLALRRAMDEPAVGIRGLYDGAVGLLETLRELGMRTVIVSNTSWRDAEGYRRDFEDLGIAGLVDGVVTSVDVGRRKPDPAMFVAGLELAGCPPETCVMVGNREEKDVVPALVLGMRAIRVAIGERRPRVSAAGAVACSMDEVVEAMRRWAREG